MWVSMFHVFMRFNARAISDVESLCRYNCDTDWETHGVPFNPDSYGGVRGWPLISADSCQPDPALALVVDASTTAADTTSQSETVGVVEIDSSGSESTDSSTVQPEASILDAQTQSTA